MRAAAPSFLALSTLTRMFRWCFSAVSADDLDLNDWLTKYIFPAEAKNVTEPFVRAGTRLGLAEMIRGGTTTYCDMYYFEDAIADETKNAGVRGVLGETIIDFPVGDNKTCTTRWPMPSGSSTSGKITALIVPALAPHAPYTVSKEHLREVSAFSDHSNAPVVMHVAETHKERDEFVTRRTARAPRLPGTIGFLSNRVIAAHTIFLTDDEIDTS